ncbi:MAG: zf-TFIIB domain-containing protein [Phycisphaerae bacterium]
MTRVEEEGVPSCICQQCFGRWIAETAMHRRTRLDVEQAQGAGAGGGEGSVMQQPLEDLVEIVATADSKMGLRCPVCEKPMVKDRYHQMIPVSIDRCRHCRSMWLDTGEYLLIRRLWVELVTSTDPRVVTLREKLAGARLEWDAQERALAEARDAMDAGIHQHGGDEFTMAELSRILRQGTGG